MPAQIILKSVVTRPDIENRTKKVLPAIKISLIFQGEKIYEKIKARLILVPGNNNTDAAKKEGHRIKQLLVKNQPIQITLRDNQPNDDDDDDEEKEE